jgi:two-component system response regulator YesN
MNATYLRELFKKTTGMTFKHYLMDRRLRYALHLLEPSRASIRVVCGESGFGDVTHFERLMKRATGKTPTEIRRGK